MEFKVSSALKDLIGKELITDDQTAIFELVKNSFDADATIVRVIFENVFSSNSKILVIDNGTGMSKNDIESKWLFVGFSEKRDDYLRLNKTIKKSARIFAGSKGIGRFSCDRLGKLLTIFTKTESEENLNELIVFWDRFETDQTQEFQNIEIDYNSVQSTLYPVINSFFEEYCHGTILLIEELNASWDEAQKLIRLKRYLQRLINPAQFKDDDFQIFIEAKDFLDSDKKNLKKQNPEQIINGEVHNFVFSKIEPNTTTVDVFINSSEVVTKLFDKGDLIFQLETSIPVKYAGLHDVHVCISYLNQYAKSVFKKMMGIDAVEFGHVYLYKNGFRIHPYGETNDDWLGVARRKQQGHYRYLGNRDIIGRVEIIGNHTELREVTSRSGGLVLTSTAERLIEFIKDNCIRILERYIIDTLDWERISDETEKNLRILELVEKIYGAEVQKTDKVVYINPRIKNLLEKKQIDKIPYIVSRIEDQLQGEKAEIGEIRESITSLNKAVEFQKKSYERKLQAANQEVELSRAITSTDYSQIMDYVHTIGIQSGTISTYLSRLFSQDIPEQLKNVLRSIKIENDKIGSISNFLTKPELLTKSTKSLRDIIDFFSSYLKNYPNLDESKFKLITEVVPAGSIFPVKFKPIDATIIIDNVISNSRKHKATELVFRFNKVSEETININFIDNGQGLDDEIQDPDLVFNRGVTTTSGSGIGLFSVLYSAKKISKKSELKVDASYDKGFKIDWELRL